MQDFCSPGHLPRKTTIADICPGDCYEIWLRSLKGRAMATIFLYSIDTVFSYCPITLT